MPLAPDPGALPLLDVELTCVVVVWTRSLWVLDAKGGHEGPLLISSSSSSRPNLAKTLLPVVGSGSDVDVDVVPHRTYGGIHASHEKAHSKQQARLDLFRALCWCWLRGSQDARLLLPKIRHV